MSPLATRRAMATALTGAAIASSLAAPAASAAPVEQYLPSGSGGASDAPCVAPPPPSSIAASAAKEYEELRPACATATESRQVVDVPTAAGGFDLPSAAIGAASGTGLVIVLLAAGGLARNRRSAVSSSRRRPRMSDRGLGLTGRREV
jgi:hypothetical protein